MKIPGMGAGIFLTPQAKAAADLNRIVNSLKVGEVIKAEVLRLMGNNQAQVKLEEQVLQAKLLGQKPQAGELVQVRVEALNPKLLLKVLNAPAEQQGTILKQSLWKALPYQAGDALERLLSRAVEEWKALGNQAVLGKENPLASVLQHRLGPESFNVLRYLFGSGLLLESKLAGKTMPGNMTAGNPLQGNTAQGNPTTGNPAAGNLTPGNLTPGNLIAGDPSASNLAAGNLILPDPSRGPWPDLKGLFLRILHTIEQKGEQSVGTREFLDLIQGAQSQSLLAKEGETSLYLPLLLWGFQQGDWGDLRIHGEGGREEKQQKKHWSVLIRLDLKSFGKLMVKLVLSSNLLHCNIRASDKETQAMIEEGLSELRGRLRSLGLEGVQCECGPLRDESEWENPERGALPEGIVKLSV